MKCTLMPGDMVTPTNAEPWFIDRGSSDNPPPFTPLQGCVYTVASVEINRRGCPSLVLEEIGTDWRWSAEFFRKVPKPDIGCITERYVRQGEDA